MITGLTRYESRVLRAVRRGAAVSRDRERPCYLIFQHPGMKMVRTAQYMIERLQARRLIAAGDNMLTLELTQEGFARLDGFSNASRSHWLSAAFGSWPMNA